MNTSKKHLYVIPVSLILLIASFVVLDSHNNSLNNVSKSFTVPEAVNNYSRYYEITTTKTLINNARIYICNGEYVSTTELDSNGYIIMSSTFDSPFVYFNEGLYSFDYGYLGRPLVSSGYEFIYSSSQGEHNKFDISISNGYTYISQIKYFSSRRYFGYASKSHKIYLDAANEEAVHPFNIKVDLHSVVTAWGNKYLIDGKCNENFAVAKETLLNMDEAVKYALYSEEELNTYKAKYESWATSLGIDPYN